MRMFGGIQTLCKDEMRGALTGIEDHREGVSS
jgi:hypothetical protein